MQLRPLCTPDLAVKGSTTEGEAHAIRCKRWSCPVCAEINRARVIAIAMKARPRALLTLTVSSRDYPDASAAAQALKEGLRLLRLRLARHPKFERFEFLAVFEKHKSGHPHLHLLIRGGFIPWKWLRATWKQITGAYMVDIRKISKAKKAAAYVAKYIGKDLSAFEGCKRWWRSHGFSKDVVDEYEPDRRYGRPTRYLVDINRLRFVMKLDGWTVETAGHSSIRWRAPPDQPGGLDLVLAAAAGRPSADFLRKSRMPGGHK